MNKYKLHVKLQKVQTRTEKKIKKITQKHKNSELKIFKKYILSKHRRYIQRLSKRVKKLKKFTTKMLINQNHQFT